MARNVEKTSAGSASGRLVTSKRSAETVAASALTKHGAKRGKYSDGVKAVSRRDRAGLIKLADR